MHVLPPVLSLIKWWAWERIVKRLAPSFWQTNPPRRHWMCQFSIPFSCASYSVIGGRTGWESWLHSSRIHKFRLQGENWGNATCRDACSRRSTSAQQCVEVPCSLRRAGPEINSEHEFVIDIYFPRLDKKTHETYISKEFGSTTLLFFHTHICVSGQVDCIPELFFYSCYISILQHAQGKEILIPSTYVTMSGREIGGRHATMCRSSIQKVMKGSNAAFLRGR